MSPFWYRRVGTSLTLVAIYNIFTPYVMSVALALKSLLLRALATYTGFWATASQRVLNKLFVGGNITLAERVSGFSELSLHALHV